MKLANFLKKYSVIDNEYIFFDEKADELICTINLYDIAKWLDIKEKKLIKILTNKIDLELFKRYNKIFLWYYVLINI